MKESMMENNGDSSKAVMVDSNLESQMDSHHEPPSDLTQERPSLAFALSLVVLGLLGYVIICLGPHGVERTQLHVLS